MAEYGNRLWEVWGKSDALYTEWAAMQEVNLNRLYVFYALDQRDGITQKKIAEYTSLPKQTVNSVIRALQVEGYLELAPGSGSDRREKAVKLTEKGRAYSKELVAPLQELENRVFAIMGAERVQQMIDTIELCNTIFEREMKRRIWDDA